VVDLVSEVKFVAVVVEDLDDVLIGVRSYVDVARNSVAADETCETTPLLGVHLLLHAIDEASSPGVLVELSFFVNHFSVFIKSLLVQIAHHIGFVGS